MAAHNLNKKLRITIITLLILIGLNAIAAGYSFILDKTGAGLGLTIAYLVHSPFQDYFLPGLVLFILIGMGSIITALFTLQDRHYSGALVLLQGLILYGWIIIQIIMVRDFNLLHLSCLLIGLFFIVGGTLMVISHSRQKFQLKTTEEISQMNGYGYGDQKLSEDMIRPLPAVIQKWLIRSGVLEKKLISRVFLKQSGFLRTKRGGRWMPVESEQYFTVKEPAFIWRADIKAAPLIHISGRDKYQDGYGHMLIKLLGLFKVADASGRETDQGSLVRYLAETMWFPSAAVSEYLSWEESGPSSAIATMSYKGTTASGKFNFNAEGDVISFEARRYYDRKDGATLETWFISIDKDGFKVFDGIRIPAKSSVTWKLKDGDFNWFNLEVTDVEYNK